ncbi:hypothetical protein Pfo_004228 [Paulownia fortunei]|nr:hypothetical protein Pfo_004228 [Paulownia fortunei]
MRNEGREEEAEEEEEEEEEGVAAARRRSSTGGGCVLGRNPPILAAAKLKDGLTMGMVHECVGRWSAVSCGGALLIHLLRG